MVDEIIHELCGVKFCGSFMLEFGQVAGVGWLDGCAQCPPWMG